MTTLLSLGILVVVILMATQAVRFRAMGLKLLAVEQAYRFHQLRDSLYRLVAHGKLREETPTYWFLSLIINLAIRNAGEWRLKHLLKVAKATQTEALDRSKGVLSDIMAHDRDVQELAAETVLAVRKMVVQNELVDYGVRIALWFKRQRRWFRSIIPVVRAALQRVSMEYVGAVVTIISIDLDVMPVLCTEQGHRKPRVPSRMRIAV